jgi:hypothetical protein
MNRDEPTTRFIRSDYASSFPRVQIKYPDSPLTVNVGDSWVEWGTDKDGMNGCDIELRPDGGFACRFQESSRVLVVDGAGVRIYDADTELEEHLIVNLSHGDYFAGLAPKVFDRSQHYSVQA